MTDDANEPKSDPLPAPEASERTPLAIGRIIGSVLFLFFLVNSVQYAVAAHSWDRRFERARVDRPVMAELDLTRAGEISIPVELEFHAVHGLMLCLDRDALAPLSEVGDEARAEIERRFEGLRAEIWLVDRDGVEIDRMALDPSRFQLTEVGLELAPVIYSDLGEFEFGVVIEEGVPDPSLSAVDAFAIYDVCGCETIVVLFDNVIAVAAGIVALFVGIFVVPGVLRHGFRRPVRHGSQAR